MTLDQLRYFVAAAKYEHVHRAARSIPISASVISQSVRMLEEELSCRLFSRDRKRMRLTQQGTRLLELARDLLERAEQIRHELGKKDLPLSGHYRIGASHFLATKVLAPVWTGMQKRFPQLTGDIYSQPTWSLIDGVLAGRLDLAVGFSPTPHPQLEIEEIFRGNSVIVVRKNHPIFKKSSRKDLYKELEWYPATMHMPSEKIFMARHHPFLKAARLERKIVFGFDSDFVALESLRASDNWCLMLDIAAAEFRKHLRAVPYPGKSEAQYTIQLIRQKSRRLDPALLEAAARIRERINQLERWEPQA